MARTTSTERGGGRPGQGRFPKPFVIAVGMSFLMLQLLFLANMSYIYATQFENDSRIHNLNLLYVDFDGGTIGQSVMDAYGALQGPGFPTVQQHSVDEYQSPTDVRNAICSGDYWGAIMANSGASDRLAAALAGNTETASQIAASNPAQDLQPALTYIWNGVRFPALSQGYVYSNIQALLQVSRSTYYARNASSALQAVSSTAANATSGPNSASVQAFLSPIPTEEIDLKPTHQGARVLYNTVTIIMPILMQFFFLMALNNISAEFGVLTERSAALTNGLLRLCLGILYNAIAGLCTAGYIWAFRESWSVGGKEYALTWLATWFYGHVNFLILDTLTAYLPMAFTPFFVLTWVIINISSTIGPFELSPGFFKWGYALPGHEFYIILVQIWSNGCANRLYRALPVLFSWWLVALVGSVFATRHRVAVARRLELREEEQRQRQRQRQRQSFSREQSHERDQFARAAAQEKPREPSPLDSGPGPTDTSNTESRPPSSMSVELPHLMRRTSETLSGGEAKRVSDFCI